MPNILLGRMLSVVLLGFALAHPAAASITVDKAEVVVTAETDRETLIVSNPRDTPAFVEISAREILNSGQNPEESNRSPDPRVVGLLAAPTRLALAPGERRAVRLQFLDPPRARDRVWRVLVQEVSGPVEAETSGVMMLIGYDVLVIQRPAAARAAVSVMRNGAELTVTNTGNSFAILIDGRQCPGGEANPCVDVVGARIYAGQTRTLTSTDASAPVTFKLKTPAGEETVRY